MVSDVEITDGGWHRVGVVWDGTNRSLYVDDVMVATDSQFTLGGSGGGLHVGCDENQTPGTFWAGMIDDVRIYNRAVRP
ncbi:MAG: LamG-like jellyroll fold domain-containing protein [Planctomycetota bacterium]